MIPNPMIELADRDRHTHCCLDQFCKVCGAHVSTYNANTHTVIQRPEAAEWDWWVACDNAECEHAYGEGLFQDEIEWIGKR